MPTAPNTPPLPATRIQALAGDILLVQMRPLANQPQDIEVVITRNGRGEDKFTIAEFSQVLTLLNQLLAKARGKVLNA